MDISALQRDPDRVRAALTETSDGSLVTSKELKIYIPSRFDERSMANVGVETYICGICAWVVEDKYYGVSLINAMMRITPLVTNQVMIGDDPYYEFVFRPGSTVVASVQLVQTSTLVYRIYDELFAKGRVPWYVKYDEFAHIFDSAKYHADANIGQDHEVTELLVSMVSRDPEDRTKYYRQTVESMQDVLSRPPAFIPLKSVAYSATNTLNKFAGSYMQDGIISALVSPSERVERIESLLRR